MLKIGLTGGIGSGKTTVARVFEMLGVPVFYADSEAKKLMNKDRNLRLELIELFGQKAFTDKGLNREFIAEKVFNDRILLEKLNTIVHPAVHKKFLSWIEKYSDRPYIMEEAAILFESGAFHFFDYTIMVTAPESIRINRVMTRDKTSEDRIRERMSNQLSDEKKLSLVDFVIKNDDHSLVLPQVLKLHKKLISLNMKT